jgi:hypothetical protein
VLVNREGYVLWKAIDNLCMGQEAMDTVSWQRGEDTYIELCISNLPSRIFVEVDL